MSLLMYRVAGGASVLLFAELLRGVLCRKTDGTGAQIGGFLTLFRQLRRGIAYHRAPVGEILARVDPSVLAACAGRGAPPNADSLSSLAEGCVFYDEGLEEIVRDAAQKLGRGYHDEQVAACDGYVARLEALARDHAVRARERCGVLSVLIRTAAAGVVILLW